MKKNVKKKNDLNLLDEYRSKIKVYMSKYNLYEDEINVLFDNAQKDIYTSNLNDISFEEYMVKQFDKKVDENKAAARSRFKLFINKKSELKEFTRLNDDQVLLLIKHVQYLIFKNELRDNQINEEFLIKCSAKYRI